ncbi:MAG: peptidylprolyl isomerase [bacterium]
MTRVTLANAVVTLLACGALACLVAGCTKGQEDQVGKTAEAEKTVQPAPPGTVRASHILISYKGTPVETATRTKEEAQTLAQDLLARARKGESFEQLAATYSDCPSAEAGGDLGFFGRGRMVKPFEDAAFGLKPGQMSDVVETQFGYHVIKRTQ